MTSAEAAAGRIPDEAIVAIVGAGGGLVEPDELLAAIQRRFLATGHPRNLTLVHAQGLGDARGRGLDRLAHAGLVKRVIGAHWAWSPRLRAMAANEEIEAYALPGGVIQHLLREIGAGRPGLITHIGLGTMVDPRHGGGRMNKRAVEPLVETLTLGGKTFLRYLPMRIDIALLRGTRADAAGNTSFEEEGAELDALVAAVAAHNCGGQVLVQVREETGASFASGRPVRLPAALVDAVVVVPGQMQSHAGDIGVGQQVRAAAPAVAGDAGSPAWTAERLVIAARARDELREGAILSVGIGVADGVLRLPGSAAILERCYQTLDHGHYGGEALQGVYFGFVRNAEATIDSPTQFDLYSGGGIDIAFLGFGEFDAEGNVNVSRLGGRIVGPGGFIEISQRARKVVFCGTLEAKGLALAIDGQRLRIERAGVTAKAVARVAEVTFSGSRARAEGQQVLIVTERAVFRLAPEGVVLAEIAPGIDLQRDVLGRMGFAPILPPEGPAIMAASPLWSLIASASLKP